MDARSLKKMGVRKRLNSRSLAQREIPERSVVLNNGILPAGAPMNAAFDGLRRQIHSAAAMARIRARPWNSPMVHPRVLLRPVCLRQISKSIPHGLPGKLAVLFTNK